MFIDEITGELSQPLEKQEKLITKTRTKEYYRIIVDRKTKVETVVLVGRGFEIVEARSVRKTTLDKINGETKAKQDN